MTSTTPTQCSPSRLSVLAGRQCFMQVQRLTSCAVCVCSAGLAEHDVVAAVSQRFTAAEITAALAFLQQQGLVNASGVKRPLMLSRLFAEHLEVTTHLSPVHNNPAWHPCFSAGQMAHTADV